MIAVIRIIIPNDIPLSIICPYNNCPGATVIVATAVEKADTRPNMLAGTDFCIKVNVNTFDNDKDNIIPMPHNAKKTAIA